MTYFSICIVILFITFGFLNMKYGDYYNGVFIMRNDYLKAKQMFESSIKKHNLKDKCYYKLGICYEKVADEKLENKKFNLSKAFESYFNAIYYSKENDNHKLLEKSKNSIQKLYYSFSEEEKEKNLNHIFSLYNSNFHLPRYLSIVNIDLSNMYKDFEKMDNIYFNLFRENAIKK